MSGPGFTCDVGTATCVSGTPLAAGATSTPVTVVTRLTGPGGALTNLAYVAPAPGDVSETNPLGSTPLPGDNPGDTSSDNDTSAGSTPVSAGDHVWLDTNRNGIQDAGEAPVADVLVTLKDASGTVLATTKTDANGFYSFTGLSPRTTYDIVITPPHGLALTTSKQGGDGRADSDADPATGTIRFTTPDGGANSVTTPDDPTLDAGLVTPAATPGPGDGGTGSLPFTGAMVLTPTLLGLLLVFLGIRLRRVGVRRAGTHRGRHVA